MEGWAQWGHNRDGEDLKQTNIAMVTDGEGIPVLFRMPPGSIADMSVMKDTVRDMKDMGCNGRMVMDRGFESAGNISALMDLDMDFTIPSNVKAEPIKKLMSKAIDELKAFVVFDPSKASYDITKMMSMVSETEMRLENTKHRDPELTYRKLRRSSGGIWTTPLMTKNTCTSRGSRTHSHSPTTGRACSSCWHLRGQRSSR